MPQFLKIKNKRVLCLTFAKMSFYLKKKSDCNKLANLCNYNNINKDVINLFGL